MTALADVMKIDLALCAELDKLVENLTTSGKPQLEAKQLKELKKICRQSDDYVKKCFHLLMTQLEKPHSEIRLSAVQVTNELFMRSHCFRDLMLNDFQYFMELVLETNSNYPLPAPHKAAKTLKSQAASFIHTWNQKFGDVYKKLALGYHFLKDCKKINFEDVNVRTVAERQLEEDRRNRTALQHREKLKKTEQEMTEMFEEIKTCITQGDNCLALLLPDPDSFDIQGLLSPDIFHKGNPWTKQKSTTSARNRHVNKSTKKRKSSDLGGAEPESKQEKLDLAIVKTETDNSTDGKSTECNTPIDVKPTAEELEKSLASYQAKPTNERSNCDQDSNTSSQNNDQETDEQEHSTQQTQSMREHGVHSQTYSLEISVTPQNIQIVETSDNTDILRNLRDCERLIDGKFLPAIAKWLEVFAKMATDESLTKKALDIKQALNKLKEKVRKLDVIRAPRLKLSEATTTAKPDADSDEDDGNDFEEVQTKEGYEPDIPEALREEYGLKERPPKPPTNPDWVLSQDIVRDEEDPASYMSTVKALKDKLKAESDKPKAPVKDAPKLDPGPSTSSAKQPAGATKAASDAPAIPYGTDLHNWGQELVTPQLIRYDTEHMFLPTKVDAIDSVDQNALASMTSRVMNYTGKFEPVRWMCRAPMPNGTLCQRMDRVKCPFHGKIVPRNTVGQPTDEEDRARIVKEEQRKNEERGPDWDDPDFQRDLAAATGVELERKNGKKGKKSRPKRYPGLTDTKKVHNTARTRLETKIFNRQAMRRVSDAMNCIDEKRRKDKFGNSFNYVHSRTKK